MRHRPSASVLALLAPFALLCAGCAALDLRTPRVDLVDVDMEQIGLLESTLLVTVRVENPNAFRLPIERGIYTFFLAGERIGTGATRRPLDVPARSSSYQQVAIELDNANLLAGLRSLLDREVDYRIEAEHFVRAFGERSVRSVSEGEVDLAAALRGSRAARSSPSG
jgi:LEA14-like dessication related protein